MSDHRGRHKDPDMEGWLLKWTNYIKGYQRRWFVLSNGLLSYYRNPADKSNNCRGSLSILNALIHTEDSCNFLISNGGAQTFHLRASNEIERSNWVTALELAKSRISDSDEDDDLNGRDINTDKQELQAMMKNLMTKLDELKTCHDLNVVRATALLRSLTDLEKNDNPTEVVALTKSINERATLFRITSSAMIKSSNEYLTLSHTHGKKWQRLLQREHESKLKMEDMLEQLARQLSSFEQKAREGGFQSPKHSASDDEEFYDAEEADFFVSFPGRTQRQLSTLSSPTGSGSKGPKGSQFSPNDLVAQGGSKPFKSKTSSSSTSSGSGSKERDPYRVPSLEEDDSTGTESDGQHTERRDLGVVQKKGTPASRRNSQAAGSSSGSSSNRKHRSDSACSSGPLSELSNNSFNHSGDFGASITRRRRTIPERPNQSLNLWSFMKNAIGKELTKIPMPVNFNEPLSMLQRVTEDFEYADLLHKAAKITDPCEQLTYIAAFAVSCYANSCVRTGKPFNPLLGETYECDRSQDLGWKSIAEQVSHHPPMLAMHSQGRGWTCWSEFSISSKFRGKYLQVNPIDITHLELEKFKYHFTWRKVTSTVHNIIVGKLWIDNHGDMNIVNHTTGDECHLKFIPYSYFSREVPRKVTGVVVNKDGEAKWVLQGTWDAKMEASKVIDSHGTSKGKPILQTATPKVIWKRNNFPEDSEKMYNLTLLAIQLNELEDGVAPTDSRFRPDQRLMENGMWPEANVCKSKLEDKQRTVRRKREEEAEMAAAAGRPFPNYDPLWFERTTDPITGNPVFIYTNKYWESKKKSAWEKCPQIYNIEDTDLDEQHNE